MALDFDLTPEELEQLEDGDSIYLTDPEKGLELVRSILERDSRAARTAEESLQSRIAPLLAGLDLDVEMETYQELARLSDRMKDQQRIALLEERAVLGIGGRFSAGKSAFINSLAEVSLPENQLPTTSIASYVIHANKNENFALTIRNRRVPLDEKAVRALTHQFYETYQIGFARVIRNLVVCTASKKFARYPHIAILDTPGYSKPDSDKMKSATDAEFARRILESADYLIWLIDSENGTIKNEDKEFLLSLNIKTPVLFVFNKADMKPEADIRKIVQDAGAILKDSSISVYSIIAYNSQTGQTLIGGDTLEKFLQMVNDSEANRQSIRQQIYRVRAEVLASIARREQQLIARRREAGEQIYTAADTERMEAQLGEYRFCTEQLEQLRRRRKQIKSEFENQAGGNVTV